VVAEESEPRVRPRDAFLAASQRGNDKREEGPPACPLACPRAARCVDRARVALMMRCTEGRWAMVRVCLCKC
jgi:hypothetical protein